MSNASRHPTHPTTEPDDVDKGEPRRATRNIPLLAWIVIGIMAAWLVIAMVQRAGTDVTPQGGTTPTANQDEAVVPAAPPTGAAPGTPEGRTQ